MRVALVSSSLHLCPPTGYGSEVTTWYLARELSAMGHEVVLFAPEGSRDPPGGQLVTIPGPLGPGDDHAAAEGSVLDHRDLLVSCDVLHDLGITAAAHEQVHHQLGEALPHLVTLNGISFHTPRAPADHNIVVVSEAAKRHGMSGKGAWDGTPWDQFKADPGRLREEPFVVHYGTDTDFYRPARNSPRDYLVYVGRPHPAKGIDLILDLAEHRPRQEVYLVWRASLPDHQEWERVYQEQIRTRGLRNVTIVHLPEGPRHHLVKRAWMDMALAALHPAVYADACPSTVLEALSCGTPVVAVNRGGLSEMVEPGVTGELVDLPERYWEGASWELLESAVERAATLDRQTIRQIAVTSHSAVVMALNYLSLYDEVRRHDDD